MTKKETTNSFHITIFYKNDSFLFAGKNQNPAFYSYFAHMMRANQLQK